MLAGLPGGRTVNTAKCITHADWAPRRTLRDKGVRFHPEVQLAMLEDVKRRRIMLTEEAARVRSQAGLGP